MLHGGLDSLARLLLIATPGRHQPYNSFVDRGLNILIAFKLHIAHPSYSLSTPKTLDEKFLKPNESIRQSKTLITT